MKSACACCSRDDCRCRKRNGAGLRETFMAAEFHATNMPDGRFAPDVETNLFRIAQEALNNVYKHAHATSVDVFLLRRNGSLVLTVEDNGRGFEPNGDQPDTGIGLLGMRERAFLLNGSVEIEWTVGSGTTVIVTVPGVLGRSEKPLTIAPANNRREGCDQSFSGRRAPGASSQPTAVVRVRDDRSATQQPCL